MGRIVGGVLRWWWCSAVVVVVVMGESDQEEEDCLISCCSDEVMMMIFRGIPQPRHKWATISINPTMLPTPDTSHCDFDYTYEPAEDSFLILDNLTSESQYLTDRFRGSHAPLVVEVGTGSGVVIAFLSAHCERILGHGGCISLGIDVNHRASQATRTTVEKATRDTSAGTVLFDQLDADLLSALKPQCIDLLIFNPPYVPTETLPALPALPAQQHTPHEDPHSESSRLLALSYAGGADGMEVTERLLQALPLALEPDRGVAYVLLCRANGPERVKQRVRDWGSGWEVRTVKESGRRAGWERLEVVRIERTGVR